MSLLLALSLATQAAVPLDAAALLAGTAGKWRGELQYRDYQSNRWEGLPVDLTIAIQPDGVTTIRTARFDDGPQTGIVWITTIAIVDSAAGTQSYAMFRKGRPTDNGTARLSMPKPATDATHWTVLAEERRRDGNSMALVRETMTRDGSALTTLKEVDPEGDGKTEWLPRNRTVLTLVE